MRHIVQIPGGLCASSPTGKALQAVVVSWFHPTALLTRFSLTTLQAPLQILATTVVGLVSPTAPLLSFTGLQESTT
ncbi:MAG: hypothetical protein LZT29_00614 [Pantoea stewartii]|nr:MAG: hypothetical protein LZT29_00614 [Pantoea stewartii]